MGPETLATLLDAVARGEVLVPEAVEHLSRLPVADVGCARLDTHRALRTGLPEVIYCPGKTPAQIRTIAAEMLTHSDTPLLATRADLEAYEAVRDLDPGIRYDPIGRVVVLRARSQPRVGTVAIVSAGTADLPVAQEAATVAGALGLTVRPIADVGVAGLHRTLAAQDEMRAASVVIVVAGMEGALPSVVAGLIAAPVIAVPTSVGYGAAFEGLAALLAMLNSCAPGIAVVNIDNGFGAAVLAHRILGGRT